MKENAIQKDFDKVHTFFLLPFFNSINEKDVEKTEEAKKMLFELVRAYNNLCRLNDLEIKHTTNLEMILKSE